MEKKWEITPFILRFLTCSLTEVVFFFFFFSFSTQKPTWKCGRTKWNIQILRAVFTWLASNPHCLKQSAITKSTQCKILYTQGLGNLSMASGRHTCGKRKIFCGIPSVQCISWEHVCYACSLGTPSDTSPVQVTPSDTSPTSICYKKSLRNSVTN